MPPQITTLIDTPDRSELVRDQIAAILVTELAGQQALAEAADPPADPAGWELRIFTERTNPWAEFIDAPEQSEAIPIVNVAVDTINYDPGSSSIVERQRATCVYNIDCYAYGVSEDDGADGHTPGDARAALEVQRAARLVRNILMAGTYAYLAMRGTVWKRWIQSITVLRPSLSENTVQQVVAARIAFAVDFNEFSPQVEGAPIALIAGTVRRKETGEVFLSAHFEVPPPSP